MSGFTKVSSAIVAVFISCFLIFTCLVYFQITQNIEEETTSALSQVQKMVTLNLPADAVKTIAEQSPHLSVRYFTGRISSDGIVTNTMAVDNANSFIHIPLYENYHLIITPHASAELRQNLDFFYLVAALFLATFVLLLLTLRVAVKQRLEPLNQLSKALKVLKEGTLTQQFAHSDIHELNEVINEFQNLQVALNHKEQQLVKIDKQLALLQEQERSYLAQELHDNVGQLLTTIKAHAYILVNSHEQSVLQLSAKKVQEMSHQISNSIRILTAHLHPLVLDKVSLHASLEKLVYEQELAMPAIQWDVSINLKGYKEDRERDIHIYRFVQEALNNVVKHASATMVNVDIVGNEQKLSVEISDNGCGLNKHVVENIGMSSMRSRARCIGGTCSILPAQEKSFNGAPINRGVRVTLNVTLLAPSTQLDAIVA